MTFADYIDEALVANPGEVDGGPSRLFHLGFGAYGATHIYAWADHLEDAFEAAVEHLDDQGLCGAFTFLTDAEYQEAAEELGRTWDSSDPDPEVIDKAEADLSPIGWTTLDCERESEGKAFVASWEWTAREVNGEERARIEARSWAEMEED